MTTNIYPPCFYRVSVKALIYKKNKILLVKEPDGRWELPGGGLEIEESIFDGIKREVKEELGVNVIKVSSQPQSAWVRINEGKPVLILPFIVEVDSFEFKNDPKESVEIDFFLKQEIQKINLHPNIQKLPDLLDG